MQYLLFLANSNGLGFGLVTKLMRQDLVPPALRLHRVKKGYKTGNTINPVYLDTEDSPTNYPSNSSLPLCTYHISNQGVGLYPIFLIWAGPLSAYWGSGTLSWQLMLLPSWNSTAKKLHGQRHVVNQGAKMTTPADEPFQADATWNRDVLPSFLVRVIKKGCWFKPLSFVTQQQKIKTKDNFIGDLRSKYSSLWLLNVPSTSSTLPLGSVWAQILGWLGINHISSGMLTYLWYLQLLCLSYAVSWGVHDEFPFLE